MTTLKTVMRLLLGVLFIAAGVYHFVRPEFYMRIVPPYLPRHYELVLVSGVFEVQLGVLLLVPRYRVDAAWGLIALLIAVFPANVHMALHTEDYAELSPVVLYARLPLQGLLIAWAWWFTRPDRIG